MGSIWNQIADKRRKGEEQGMENIRDQIAMSYRQAQEAQSSVAISTLRLIQVALKDRDAAARDKGQPDGIEEEQIVDMLRSMIRERYESIDLYEQGCRIDLAQKEKEEITIIESFLPTALNKEQIENAVEEAIKVCDAFKLKDIGRVMSHLRERFAGRIDMAEASATIKDRLL